MTERFKLPYLEFGLSSRKGDAICQKDIKPYRTLEYIFLQKDE